ncbi:MAG: nuclear transport factor 2 family protein [Nanoarchaeota archaeon]
MNKLLEEVTAFLKEYEKAANSHVFDNVKPLISDDAVYWFSDGSHVGIEQIEKAFINTFNKIRDENYMIKDVKWLVLENNFAVCIYHFAWKGIVNGKFKEGHGRGTNVISKSSERWVIIHEHLSIE